MKIYTAIRRYKKTVCAISFLNEHSANCWVLNSKKSDTYKRKTKYEVIESNSKFDTN